jgi:hypothetical protein
MAKVGHYPPALIKSLYFFFRLARRWRAGLVDKKLVRINRSSVIVSPST